MVIYKANKNFNLSNYISDSQSLEVKYGLPKDVIFCKKCTISNQRPNSTVEYQTHKQQ